MALGQDLEIDAPVSPLLLHTIQNDLQSLLADYRPEFRRIKVSATSASMGQSARHCHTATGFSAGVDSFTTLALYAGAEVPASRQIKSLTTFDVGAMGPFAASGEIFEKYCVRVQDYAGSNGFQWQTLRSNLDDFYRSINMPKCMSFQCTHVIRNVAAALVFEDIYSSYLYSSTYPYRTQNKGNDDMSYIEPIILPLLSTEMMQFVSAGAGLARYQKMEIVSAYKPAMPMLDTCVGHALSRISGDRPNCSRCWKCCRTMLNLDVLGRLTDFSDVYDIEYYQSHKQAVIQKVLESAKSGKPADIDLINQMRIRNFDHSVSLRNVVKMKLASHIGVVKSKCATIPGARSLYRGLKRQF